MLARDQSRTPSGRSIRFTSSLVNGAYFARHVQKSSASLSSDSVPELCGCVCEYAPLNDTSKTKNTAAQAILRANDRRIGANLPTIMLDRSSIRSLVRTFQ